jgi:hypothetical protein
MRRWQGTVSRKGWDKSADMFPKALPKVGPAEILASDARRFRHLVAQLVVSYQEHCQVFEFLQVVPEKTVDSVLDQFLESAPIHDHGNATGGHRFAS